MNLIFIVLLALGLSMDAFAVSISCGLCTATKRHMHALRAGMSFGIFQAGMIYLGWLAGSTFKDFIEPVDHWIAFILLLLIGIKMWKESTEEEKKILDLTNLKLLLTLAVATSIDAFAAGISISALGYSIIEPAFIVGIITFAMSYTGVLIGCWMNKYTKISKYLDRVGAVILIGIGIKILIEHLA